MHVMWKRYARSGYAPRWFYVLAAAAFVALAAWAMVEGDWIVAAIAAVMVVAAFAGGRVMRRLGEGLAESSRRVPGDVEPQRPAGAKDDGQGSS
jgi:predicted lysophospholipase L1 biosynthesis ABC-type transport system permease subunit